ncbi:MAG: 50S ribosomal protein L25/general stress protein Ctc, partial [Alphaproteobacteria bacterium]|nr:50S ribosomal protein L25/general stress protein Ctc [Alphaproteobacteria bacterium]
MPAVTAMKVQARDRAGKGAARATRRTGLVPAVIYGGKADAALIAIDPRDLTTLLHTKGYRTNVVEITIGEAKKAERTMAIEVQLHPVTDRPIHADFRRIDKDSIVRVPVPVRFNNEGASPGIKKGGVLNIVRHEIDLRGKPDDIPDHIDVDLTGLDIGDSVHIKAITLPKGLKPTIARNFTICSVAPPTVHVEEEVKPAATAEGAVAADGA